MMTADKEFQTYSFNNPVYLSTPTYKYKLIVNPNWCFFTNKRPNWFHRLMCRILLGWKWEIIKNAN